MSILSQHSNLLQRRNPVIVKYSKEIWGRYKFCTSGKSIPKQDNTVKPLLTKLCDEKTLSIEFGLMSATISFSEMLKSIPPEKQDAWKQLRKLVCDILFEIGFRTNANTPLEDKLTGGTANVSFQPLKPYGLIYGSLSLDETKTARELEVVIGVRGYHYNSKDFSVPVALEPLGEDGNAIRIPRVLDYSKLEKALKEYPLEKALDMCALPFTVSAQYPVKV